MTSIIAPVGKLSYQFYELNDTFVNGRSTLSDLAVAGFDEAGNNSRTPDAEGTTDGFDVQALAHQHGTTRVGLADSLDRRADTFAVKFNTTLVIDRAGTYTFNTHGDNGSRLFIDGEMVVDNDGNYVRSKDGSIDLERGVYSVDVIFFENHGSEFLRVRMSGPDTDGDSIALENANIGPDAQHEALADLSYESFDVVQNDDGDFVVEMSVQNTGDVDAKGASTTLYWSATAEFDRATAVELETDGHATLDAGEVDSDETEELRTRTLEELGSGYIFGVLDADGDIDESNEENNISEGVAISIDKVVEEVEEEEVEEEEVEEEEEVVETEGADLTITSAAAINADLAHGEDLKIEVAVANIGDEKARDVATQFYWSADATLDEGDTLLATDDQGAMRAGETDDGGSTRIRFETLSELGEGYIIAKVDGEGLIEETDEDNNTADAIAFTMADAPVEEEEVVGANLITNGSFEAGSGQSYQPDGWTRSGINDKSGVHVDPARATDGVNSYAFGGWGETAGNSLSQDIATTSGRDYQLSFDAGAIFGNADQVLKVEVLDATGNTIHEETVTISDDAVDSVQIRFSSATDGATIRFTHMDGEEGDLDLDSVAVVDAGPTAEVAPIADLTIVSLEGTSELAPGQDMKLMMAVANIGDEKARDVATSYFWSATETFDAETAVLLSEDRQGSMRAGEEDGHEAHRIRYEDLAVLGDGYIFAMVDGNELVEEADETNNLSEGVAFTLLAEEAPAEEEAEEEEVVEAPAQADLQVVRFGAYNTELEVGQDMKMFGLIENAGGTDARNVTTSIYWSATETFDAETAVLVGLDRQGNTDAGESDLIRSIRVRYEDLEELGEGFMFAVVDGVEEVAEADETNNVSEAVAFTLKAAEVEEEEVEEDEEDVAEEEVEEVVVAADFQAGDFVASAEFLERGVDLDLDFTISNVGGEGANTEATIYWSATRAFDLETAVELGDINYGNVSAGAEEDGRTLTIDHDILSGLGNGYVVAVIDAADEVNEGDETNNMSDMVRVRVQQPASSDLFVTHARLDDNVIAEDDDMLVFLSARNRGTLDADGVEAAVFWSATDEFDAAEAVLLDTHRIGGIDGRETVRGEEVSIDRDDLELLGDGFIFVQLNPGNGIEESNYDNNLSSGMSFELL